MTRFAGIETRHLQVRRVPERACCWKWWRNHLHGYHDAERTRSMKHQFRVGAARTRGKSYRIHLEYLQLDVKPDGMSITIRDLHSPRINKIQITKSDARSKICYIPSLGTSEISPVLQVVGGGGGARPMIVIQRWNHCCRTQLRFESKVASGKT